MTNPASGGVGIPPPRRPEHQARWGQPGYRDLVVALLPVNDYSIAEVESVLVAISRHVLTDTTKGPITTTAGDGGQGGAGPAAQVLVRTAGGTFGCTAHQLPAVVGGGQVRSVSVHWTYRDGSQLRGQLIAEGHRGRLLADPNSMAHAAAAQALEQMHRLHPGRRRWLTWMSRWLLPTTCASYFAVFTYLAWRGLLVMRAQAAVAAGTASGGSAAAAGTPTSPVPRGTREAAETAVAAGPGVDAVQAAGVQAAGVQAAGVQAAGVPWLTLLAVLATALFLFAVVLAVIAPARRYGGTRMRPGPPWSTSQTQDDASEVTTPASPAPGSGARPHAGPGAALARCVQRWPEVVVLICAFTACAWVAAAAVLSLA